MFCFRDHRQFLSSFIALTVLACCDGLDLPKNLTVIDPSSSTNNTLPLSVPSHSNSTAILITAGNAEPSVQVVTLPNMPTKLKDSAIPADFAVMWPGTSVACLLANLSSTLHVTWNSTVPSNNSTLTKDFAFNRNTSDVNQNMSTCDPKMIKLALMQKSNQNITLTLVFANMTSDEKSNAGLKQVLLSMPVTMDLFPNVTPGITNYTADNSTSAWQVPRGQVFKCNAQDGSVDLSSNNNVPKTAMTASLMLGPNVLVQAFNPQSSKENNKWSSTITQCVADDYSSEVVPIVVGVALAALVVIVLVAYFIGRRRSRRQVAILEAQ